MPSFEIQKKELTMINTLTGKSKFTLRIACRVTCFKKTSETEICRKVCRTN